MGVGPLESVEWTSSTRGHAVEVVAGPRVNTDQAVRVLVLSGRFVFRNAIVPHHVRRLPPGRYLTIVVDPSDGTTLDVGVGNERPDLSTLGPVHELTMGAR